MNVEGKWEDWRREGVKGGNKGKQVSDFKAEKERRGWRDGGRTLDSCSASSSRVEL